jgi:hypothetical protein
MNDTLGETIAGAFMEAHGRESYLTLVFARQGDAWLVVHDQNTPIR